MSKDYYKAGGIMALIVCPDCGEKVSDKAIACIHCGCPIQLEQNKEVYFKVILHSYKTGKGYSHFLKCLSSFQDKFREFPHIKLPDVLSTGISKENSEYIKKQFSIANAVVEIAEDPDCTELNTRANSKIDEMRLGIIRCPKCKSPAVTATQRGYNIVTGFIGSNKTVNRCANCGYTWKP